MWKGRTTEAMPASPRAFEQDLSAALLSAREKRSRRGGALPAAARSAAALAALLVVAASTGCSWLLMDKAPDEPPSELERAPDCTETEGWAIWDTALGSSTLVVGGLQLAIAHDTGQPALTRSLGVANLAAAGLYVASAVIGYKRANDCAEARDDYFELAR